MQDTSAIPYNFDVVDPLPGYTAFGSTGSPTSKLIWGYTPGQGVFDYPTGFGAAILPNSYICIQIHYPGGINNQLDSTQVRLKFHASNQRDVLTLSALNHKTSLTNGPLFIPANTEKIFYSKLNVTANYTLTAIMPHMHLLGTSIKSYCVKSDGDTIHLIDIPAWDFHWQGFYRYQKPVLIPAGSVLYGEAKYNNTSSNPHNPNFPPKDVSVGEGTGDEMMLIYFNLSNYIPGDANIIVDTLSHLGHYEACEYSTQVTSSLENDGITVFPVPSGDVLNVNGVKGVFDIVLYDQHGAVVFTQQNCSGNITLNSLKLPTGIFYMQLKSSENIVAYKKVVLE